MIHNIKKVAILFLLFVFAMYRKCKTLEVGGEMICFSFSFLFDDVLVY
jgi:hypothetical protein